MCLLSNFSKSSIVLSSLIFFFLFVCFVFINHTWLQSSTRSLQNPETENIETFGSDFFLFPALLSKNVPNLSRNKTRLIILIKCVGVGEFGVKQTWEMLCGAFLRKFFREGNDWKGGITTIFYISFSTKSSYLSPRCRLR